jgi:hypothetical protein
MIVLPQFRMHNKDDTLRPQNYSFRLKTPCGFGISFWRVAVNGTKKQRRMPLSVRGPQNYEYCPLLIKIPLALPTQRTTLQLVSRITT